MLRYLTKCKDELVLALVPPSKRINFTSSLYMKRYGPSSVNNGLFSWEENMINSFFPKPPSKVLVGGAGAGRELKVLSNRGYFISAFEPLCKSASLAKQVVPKKQLLSFSISGYEDLISGRLKEVEDFAPYDAVILGWSSFTHILDKEVQRLTLEKVRKLCPQGPILLSWLRALYIGPKTKLFRKLLSCLGFKKYSDTDFYSADFAFHHRFTSSEIHELASLSGNKILFYEDEKSSPHAVLLPA